MGIVKELMEGYKPIDKIIDVTDKDELESALQDLINMKADNLPKQHKKDLLKDIEILQKYWKDMTGDEMNEEKAKFKKVVDPKTHKKVGKWYCDQGLKLDRSGPKPQCKKSTQADKAAKKKAAKKAAKTRSRDKVGISKANKQRAKTNKIKKNVGL